MASHALSARAARTLRPTPGPTSTAARHLRSAAPPAVPSPCALARLPDGPKVAIAGISGAVGTEFMRVRDLFLLPLWLTPQRLLDLHHLRSSRLVLTPFFFVIQSTTHIPVSPSINFNAP